MHMREVIDQVSIREWVRLCAVADASKQKKLVKQPKQMMYRHGSGSDVQVIGQETGFARFDVLSVKRTDDNLYITVEDEDGEQIQYYLYDKKEKDKS